LANISSYSSPPANDSQAENQLRKKSVKRSNTPGWF